MRQPLDQDPQVALRAELRRLFEAQGAVRWTLARSSASDRIARLRRLKDAIVAHRGAVAEALRRDFGKSPAETEVTEIHPVLVELNHTVAHLRGWMRPQSVDAPVFLAGTRSEIRAEPKGQVLILAPWNYPFQLLISPLIAAVAAGNAAILKPSEKVPETARALATLVAAAFPEQEVAVVQGDASVATALLELPFDHVFFTGSTRVGRKVMEAAAKHLSSVTLELGGKSPAIVEPSAHLDRAARSIAWGKFVNAGQTCVAPDYVLVSRFQRDALVAKLRVALDEFYGSDEAALARNPDYCRLVDDAAFSRVKGLLDDAVQAGAKVVAGGTADPAQRFLSPTILVDVPPGSALMQEEVFGPVLPVLTYESVEEALRFVRERPKPLALYVFTGRGAEADRALDETTSGGAVVNNTLIHLANPDLPFGGVGPSGTGSYHGQAGFRAFSHERAVLRQRGNPLARFFHPPYAGRMNRLTARLMRWME